MIYFESPRREGRAKQILGALRAPRNLPASWEAFVNHGKITAQALHERDGSQERFRASDLLREPTEGAREFALFHAACYNFSALGE